MGLRFRTASVLAAGTLLLASCGGESGTDSGTGPGTGAVHNPEQLAAALVVPGDLGDGWAVQQPPEEADRVGPGVVTDDQRDKLPRIEFCPEASTGATEAAEGLEWQAFTQLNLDTGQPRRHLVFVQEFLLSDEAARVAETYDDLESGITACLRQTTEYPDGEVGRSQSLDVPDVGEARVGTREVVEEPGDKPATWDIRNVLVRDGAVLMAVTVAEIVAGDQIEPTLDDSDVEDIITTIADKLP